jgi:hypothetical protein
MVEAVRTSETSVDNHFTRQYNPEDNSEHHARRRENLKSHECKTLLLRIRTSRVKISAPRPAILFEGFRGFPQFFQTNSGIFT